MTLVGYKEHMQFHPKDLSDLDELTEEQLGFSALSEGLGLTRPKQPRSSDLGEEQAEADRKGAMAFSGIGAVSAGPARPAPSIKTGPATRAVPAANPLVEPAASRTLRVFAFLLDAAVVAVPFCGAWIYSFGEEALPLFLGNWHSPSLLFAAMLATYFLLSESFGGQSLGKMVLGLRVVEDDKYQKPTGFRHAAVRLVLLVLGTALGGLGLLASFVDFKRRPWQDRYSGSIVRKKP